MDMDAAVPGKTQDSITAADYCKIGAWGPRSKKDGTIFREQRSKLTKKQTVIVNNRPYVFGIKGMSVVSVICLFFGHSCARHNDSGSHEDML